MNNPPHRRWIALSVPLLVAAAITYGLFLAGPPSEQRKIMLDRKRVAEIGNIEQAIDLYHAREGNLPETLTLLREKLQPQLSIDDPETGRPYFYERTGKNTYRICADFSAASDAENLNRWTHDSGRHCFAFRIKTNTPGE